MLHTVNKSPFEKNSLDTCLRLCTPGSHILLIEDGVYGALTGTIHESTVRENMNERNLTLYALGADLKARGIDSSRLIEGIEVVGYGEFVDLAVNCGAVQSWL